MKEVTCGAGHQHSSPNAAYLCDEDDLADDSAPIVTTPTADPTTFAYDPFWPESDAAAAPTDGRVVG